jgi:hypothetical protein
VVAAVSEAGGAKRLFAEAYDASAAGCAFGVNHLPDPGADLSLGRRR